jgi:negative regulator of flagellin synthesis FlgM
MQKGDDNVSMRVDNTYSAYKIFSGTNQQNRHTRAEDRAARGHDVFTLSVQAEDYQLARRALSQVPDVRAERVEALRNNIESGLYTVSAAMVAEKILQEL